MPEDSVFIEQLLCSITNKVLAVRHVRHSTGQSTDFIAPRYAGSFNQQLHKPDSVNSTPATPPDADAVLLPVSVAASVRAQQLQIRICRSCTDAHKPGCCSVLSHRSILPPSQRADEGSVRHRRRRPRLFTSTENEMAVPKLLGEKRRRSTWNSLSAESFSLGVDTNETKLRKQSAKTRKSESRLSQCAVGSTLQSDLLTTPTTIGSSFEDPLHCTFNAKVYTSASFEHGLNMLPVVPLLPASAACNDNYFKDVNETFVAVSASNNVNDNSCTNNETCWFTVCDTLRSEDASVYLTPRSDLASTSARQGCVPFPGTVPINTICTPPESHYNMTPTSNTSCSGLLPDYTCLSVAKESLYPHHSLHESESSVMFSSDKVYDINTNESPLLYSFSDVALTIPNSVQTDASKSQVTCFKDDFNTFNGLLPMSPAAYRPCGDEEVRQTSQQTGSPVHSDSSNALNQYFMSLDLVPSATGMHKSSGFNAPFCVSCDPSELSLSSDCLDMGNLSTLPNVTISSQDVNDLLSCLVVDHKRSVTSPVCVEPVRVSYCQSNACIETAVVITTAVCCSSVTSVSEGVCAGSKLFAGSCSSGVCVRSASAPARTDMSSNHSDEQGSSFPCGSSPPVSYTGGSLMLGGEESFEPDYDFDEDRISDLIGDAAEQALELSTDALDASNLPHEYDVNCSNSEFRFVPRGNLGGVYHEATRGAVDTRSVTSTGSGALWETRTSNAPQKKRAWRVPQVGTKATATAAKSAAAAQNQASRRIRIKRATDTPLVNGMSSASSSSRKSTVGSRSLLPETGLSSTARVSATSSPRPGRSLATLEAARVTEHCDMAAMDDTSHQLVKHTVNTTSDARRVVSSNPDEIVLDETDSSFENAEFRYNQQTEPIKEEHLMPTDDMNTEHLQLSPHYQPSHPDSLTQAPSVTTEYFVWPGDLEYENDFASEVTGPTSRSTSKRTHVNSSDTVAVPARSSTVTENVSRQRGHGVRSASIGGASGPGLKRQAELHSDNRSNRSERANKSDVEVSERPEDHGLPSYDPVIERPQRWATPRAYDEMSVRSYSMKQSSNILRRARDRIAAANRRSCGFPTTSPLAASRPVGIGSGNKVLDSTLRLITAYGDQQNWKVIGGLIIEQRDGPAAQRWNDACVKNLALAFVANDLDGTCEYFKAFMDALAHDDMSPNDQKYCIGFAGVALMLHCASTNELNSAFSILTNLLNRKIAIHRVPYAKPATVIEAAVEICLKMERYTTVEYMLNVLQFFRDIRLTRVRRSCLHAIMIEVTKQLGSSIASPDTIGQLCSIGIGVLDEIVADWQREGCGDCVIDARETSVLFARMCLTHNLPEILQRLCVVVMRYQSVLSWEPVLFHRVVRKVLEHFADKLLSLSADNPPSKSALICVNLVGFGTTIGVYPPLPAVDPHNCELLVWSFMNPCEIFVYLHAFLRIALNRQSLAGSTETCSLGFNIRMQDRPVDLPKLYGVIHSPADVFQQRVNHVLSNNVQHVTKSIIVAIDNIRIFFRNLNVAVGVLPPYVDEVSGSVVSNIAEMGTAVKKDSAATGVARNTQIKTPVQKRLTLPNSGSTSTSPSAEGRRMSTQFHKLSALVQVSSPVAAQSSVASGTQNTNSSVPISAGRQVPTQFRRPSASAQDLTPTAACSSVTSVTQNTTFSRSAGNQVPIPTHFPRLSCIQVADPQLRPSEAPGLQMRPSEVPSHQMRPPQGSGPQMMPQQAAGSQMRPPQAADPRMRPPLAAGPQMRPSQSAGPQMRPPQAADPRMRPPLAAGPHMRPPPQAASPQMRPSQSAGPQMRPPQSAGPQMRPPQAAGPQMRPPQTAGPQMRPPQAAGAQMRPPLLRPAEQFTVREQLPRLPVAQKRFAAENSAVGTEFGPQPSQRRKVLLATPGPSDQLAFGLPPRQNSETMPAALPSTATARQYSMPLSASNNQVDCHQPSPPVSLSSAAVQQKPATSPRIPSLLELQTSPVMNNENVQGFAHHQTKALEATVGKQEAAQSLQTTAARPTSVRPAAGLDQNTAQVHGMRPRTPVPGDLATGMFQSANVAYHMQPNHSHFRQPSPVPSAGGRDSVIEVNRPLRPPSKFEGTDAQFSDEMDHRSMQTLQRAPMAPPTSGAMAENVVHFTPSGTLYKTSYGSVQQRTTPAQTWSPTAERPIHFPASSEMNKMNSGSVQLPPEQMQERAAASAQRRWNPADGGNIRGATPSNNYVKLPVYTDFTEESAVPRQSAGSAVNWNMPTEENLGKTSLSVNSFSDTDYRTNTGSWSTKAQSNVSTPSVTRSSLPRGADTMILPCVNMPPPPVPPPRLRMSTCPSAPRVPLQRPQPPSIARPPPPRVMPPTYSLAPPPRREPAAPVAPRREPVNTVAPRREPAEPVAIPPPQSGSSAVFRLIKQEILQRLEYHVSRGVALKVDLSTYAVALADGFYDILQGKSTTGSVVLSDSALDELMAHVDRVVERKLQSS